ncbi:hypothetical protein NKH47_12460 [Mesorhizobium sp. M1060]|uniref:hypothetical protein n=1 Tax=unclassified Mesorhizobium TaxID=325217 RepID=UPI0003CFB94B|nr:MULTISPECIES: hypothetical protein [unclassified Mesorhizobium]ESZ09334.1 hypothetical protein X736_04700 [Mesorhizobium sp. L2C089B000]WJI48398.1 hypothetical protein NLY44_16955 [Mesorhizobium sp. C089B]
MLTEEGKRSLYSHARDDAERQRLLAAFHTDGKTEATRQLFETMAFLIIIGCLSLGAAALALWMASPFVALNGKWMLCLAVGTFLAAGIAINWSFDGQKGKLRRERAELTARRYGYPIILAAGLCAGWLAQPHFESTSERGYAQRATIRACLQVPKCVELANRINNDGDVAGALSN